MLTKNSFSKTRAVILGLTSLVDLVVAILFLVIVINDWASFDTLQKTITLTLFFINVLSALILAFMCILRSRSRPLGDLGRGVVLLLFQIGSIVTFTLAAPFLPCAAESSLHSCRVHLSAILYATCISCVLLVLFFLFLFPLLRLSKGQFVMPQPADKPLSSPVSDTASTLTYYSWDRNPEKGLKHTSMDSYYSQGSYAASYKYSLYGEKSRSYGQKPLAIKKNEKAGGLPVSRIQSADRSPSSTLSPLRPYTPPPPEPAVVAHGPTHRASVSSVGSQDTLYAASWLMEPPRAVLSSPKRSPKSRGSLALESEVYSPQGPKLQTTPRDTPPTRTAKTLAIPKPITIHRKPKPHMLSIDSVQSTDTGLSDVPRSPSPIDPYSPHSPFHLTPPSSGMLPKHPRLTMHLRDAAAISRTHGTT